MTGHLWHQRRLRVDALRRAHPQAQSFLEFYGRVLTVQESAARDARLAWVGRNVERAQHRAFRRLVKDVEPGATDVISQVARQLTTSKTVASNVLEAFVQQRPLDDLAASIGCEVAPLEFFPRAFMQAVHEGLAALHTVPSVLEPDQRDASSSLIATCPRCGRMPQVAVLRDEPELKGARTLVCSLCATEWPIARSTCPHCGEVEPGKLEHHIAESWLHLRVEECQTCRVYVKSVDLRVDGTAQPLVDELASVELDLWARARGLRKLHLNILGL